MRRSGIRLRRATEVDDPAMIGIAAPCLPEVIRVCPKLRPVSAGVDVHWSVAPRAGAWIEIFSALRKHGLNLRLPGPLSPLTEDSNSSSICSSTGVIPDCKRIIRRWR
jgi:hypothetical protein